MTWHEMDMEAARDGWVQTSLDELRLAGVQRDRVTVEHYSHRSLIRVDGTLRYEWKTQRIN